MRISKSTIRESQRIRCLGTHQVPGSGSDVKEREKVEAESSIQNAGRRCKALAHHQRLTMHRLSVAHAILCNLHVLYKGASKMYIPMETRNVFLGGQTTG